MLRALVVFAAVICCSIFSAHAAQKTAMQERVIAVVTDGSLMLSASGAAVLANIYFPNRAGAEAWLSEYVLQREITVNAGAVDRYGRVSITSSVQNDMLNDGAAVFYAAEGPIPAEWKAAEARARAAKHGVWSDPNLALLLTPETAAQHTGNFAVVEGSVTRIYEAKSATYINFGENWRDDFSITIPAKLRRSMKPMLQQLKAGTKLRVRGFISEENGPMIRLMHGDNLELR